MGKKMINPLPHSMIMHSYHLQNSHIEFMSKKLFTRLELGDSHGQSERAVTALLEGIVSASAEVYEDGAMSKISKKMLTKEIMYREVHSVGQAFPTDPREGPLREEDALKLKVREGNRPFSAKIEKVYRNQSRASSSKKSIYGNMKCSSNRSTYKYSVCQSAKSREPKKYGNSRPTHDRFFAIQPEYSQEDSVDEAFIDALRAKKAQEQAYQRAKENFLKTSVEQGEKYGKLNRKFLQTMGNKPYYYNRSGQTVELAPSRFLKKTASNRLSRQDPPSKHLNEVRSDLTVEYQDKESYFKPTRQAFEIEARPAVLFYKSEQCKYQIIA